MVRPGVRESLSRAETLKLRTSGVEGAATWRQRNGKCRGPAAECVCMSEAQREGSCLRMSEGERGAILPDVWATPRPWRVHGFQKWPHQGLSFHMLFCK